MAPGQGAERTASGMTAPAGAIVRLYVDLVARVKIDDVIETQSGRGYRVLGVREQQRGKHAGRQHLQCLVLAAGWQEDATAWAEWMGFSTIHEIRWYKRGRARARRPRSAA